MLTNVIFVAARAVVWIAIPAVFFGPQAGLRAEDLPNKTAEVTVLSEAGASVESSRPTTTPADAESNTAIFKQLHLDLAKARLNAAELAGYSAVLEIQEERDEQLKPSDRVLVKIRHQPFSVYLRWNESGQEVIFVDGKNDNRLLVKPTSALAALKRVWRLDPESRLAKQSCKYAITSSGIEKLTARVQEFYATHDRWLSAVQCRQCTDTVAHVAVKRYDVRFTNKEVSPEFCGGRYCFEVSTGLLIAVENFGWSDTPDDRLLERYIYHAINREVKLIDADFDQANPNYEFAVQ